MISVKTKCFLSNHTQSPDQQYRQYGAQDGDNKCNLKTNLSKISYSFFNYIIFSKGNPKLKRLHPVSWLIKSSSPNF